MWEYNFNNEIYHHGVKGQKWGRRKKVDEASVKTSRLTRSQGDTLYSPKNTTYSPNPKRNTMAKRYATRAIAGALGSMSVDIAAHTLMGKRYKSGKQFAKSMIRSGIFGASIGSVVASFKMPNEDYD